MKPGHSVIHSLPQHPQHMMQEKFPTACLLREESEMEKALSTVPGLNKGELKINPVFKKEMCFADSRKHSLRDSLE